MMTEIKNEKSPWSGIGPKAVVVAVVLALVTALAGAFGSDLYEWIAGRGKPRLEVLDVRVLGEPASSPDFNADALARIVAVYEFPRVEFVVKNTGDAGATLREVSVAVERVWRLEDPYGPRLERTSPRPPTPDFEAYGPNDVRLEPDGFAVPETLDLAIDVAAGGSTTVSITLRTIAEPSIEEFVFLLDFEFRYETDQATLQSVLVSSQAIGSYFPEYDPSPPSYVPETDK